MTDWLFSHIWGWVGVTTIVVAACVAVGWFFPQLRTAAAALAAAAISATAIYGKGRRDRAAEEKRKKEEAVRRVEEKYDEIDKRPDTPSDVEKRLDRGTF